MNIQEKKGYIEQKIKEANPDLMKLEFGQRVEVYIPADGEPSDCIEYTAPKIGYATYIEPSEPMTFLDGEHIYDIYASDFKDGELEYIDDEDGIVATIIGKEIQLHHVLLVLQQLGQTEFFIQKGDGLAYITVNGITSGENELYNVSKSFNEQSDKFYEFLYQIMNK